MEIVRKEVYYTMKKRRILFSNYYHDMFSDENIEWAKQGMFEEGIEETDENIDDYIYRENEFDWNCFKDNLECFIKGKNDLLVTGTLGLWYGRREGGKIIKNMFELFELFKDCDYIKFEEENGHLYITASHHDGTNYYEVKELTDKGEEYASNHYWDSDREVHTTIWNSNFLSRLPRIDF